MSLAPCRLPRCRVECQMHSPPHLHKGVTYTVHEILTFISRLISFCLQPLHHRFVDWTKPSNTALILGTLSDLARSKSELVAENALLRKPLIILRRHMKRPARTKTDRMLLVLLARMVRAWKQALFIVQEDDVTAVASPGFPALLEVHIQSSYSQIKDIRRDRGLHQGNGQRQPTVGSGADSWRIAQVGYTRLQTHHSEIYATGAHNSTTWAELEDLLTHSCRADLGLRLPPCHGSLLPLAVRLLHHRTALAQSDPRRRDTISH